MPNAPGCEPPPTPVRRRLLCRGTVQGVGFRPTVHRLATSMGLGGWVINDPDGARIEVEGPAAALDAFAADLPARMPPLAALAELVVEEIAPLGETSFSVRASREGRRRGALIPPDAVLCADCRAEMEDPADRRHRYAFTTCTNCGPRYSLALALPYDRMRTSMACFELCPDCRAEYEDPAGRRFHAEPICCPACGPTLRLLAGGEERARGPEAIAAARSILAGGGIVATKGLGGFQLVCRADDDGAVGRLRSRKRRPTKPFAVMARDLASARTLVRMSEADEALLAGTAAPILLAPVRTAAAVRAAVAPGLNDLGVMLPTTPLHVELFRDAPYDALVATSGNVTDEPICRGSREALERLGPIADALLLHDRDVVRRVDDSVVRAASDGHFVVRRSRGWVPQPVPLPVAAPEPLLALGGFLQTTACLSVGGDAFPSPHVGDLETELARAFLVEAAQCLEEFLEARPRVLAADLHPDYPSTWLAEKLADERGGRLLQFQHHLAHAAAVLGEHGLFPGPREQVAAVVLDGTGWGTDGTAWGCEWLLLDGDLRWTRAAHATPFPLVGGERAVREPWRVAVALLAAAGAAERVADLPLARRVEAATLESVASLAGNEHWPLACGAGRIFEAAGALLGLAVENGWEGEAAARLEALAASCTTPQAPWPDVTLPADRPELPAAALLAEAARRTLAGEGHARIASGFHATFCRLAAHLTVRVVPREVRTVALGGGCLVNRLLREGLARELREGGLQPILPRRLPPGDGGLSYGQTVLAAASLARDRAVSPA